MLELELAKLGDELDVPRGRQHVHRALKHLLARLRVATHHSRGHPRRPHVRLLLELLARRLVRSVSKLNVARPLVRRRRVKVYGPRLRPRDGALEHLRKRGVVTVGLLEVEQRRPHVVTVTLLAELDLLQSALRNLARLSGVRRMGSVADLVRDPKRRAAFPVCPR